MLTFAAIKINEYKIYNFVFINSLLYGNNRFDFGWYYETGLQFQGNAIGNSAKATDWISSQRDSQTAKKTVKEYQTGKITADTAEEVIKKLNSL